MMTIIGGSQSTDLKDLFDPLNLEQGLYLLDKLTWFPERGLDHLDRIAEYVAERARSAPAPDATQIGVILQRLAESAPAIETGTSTKGRWRDIPDAKHLYELKYDLKTALLPDRFYSFMNMGWAEPGEPMPDLSAWLDPEERIWAGSAQLYERVAGAHIAGHDVLEVGCGRAGGAAYLVRRHPVRSYLAVDQSAANLAFGRRYAPPGLELMKGDAEALGLPDSSADIVINIESAHCYPHPERFLAEVHRVLRPGGLLLLADEWWTADELQLVDRVVAAGFDVEEEADLTDGVIESLERLREPMAARIAAAPSEQHGVYERFFGERVLVESRESYASGRFRFTLVVGRR